MKISNNFINQQLNKTTKQLYQTLNQLSTGKRINSAKDDPATSAILKGLESASRSLQTANNNISVAKSSLSIAEGAGTGAIEILQRAREIAVQASNGTLSDQDRSNLSLEFNALVEQIDLNASQTNFNGNHLVEGGFSEEIQSGPNQGDTSTISVGSLTSSALGMNAAGVSTQSDAQDALATIDTALSRAFQVQSEIGAQQSALEYRENANAIQNENILAAASQAGDTDIAQATAELTQQSILQQAQIAVSKTKNKIDQQYQTSLLNKKFEF